MAEEGALKGTPRTPWSRGRCTHLAMRGQNHTAMTSRSVADRAAKSVGERFSGSPHQNERTISAPGQRTLSVFNSTTLQRCLSALRNYELAIQRALRSRRSRYYLCPMYVLLLHRLSPPSARLPSRRRLRTASRFRFRFHPRPPAQLPRVASGLEAS